MKKKVKKKMKVCEFCQKETNRLAISNPPTCMTCYSKQNKKAIQCKICKKYYKSVSEKTKICQKCQGYKRPKEICFGCGEKKAVVFRKEENPYCRLCYRKLFQKRKKCDICGKIERLSSKKEKNICYICFNKINYSIERRLRDRVRSCFKIFSKNGKIKTSDEYGINYKLIIEHLGSCPGNLEEYHIDHIKPLCTFDFNDLEQIKLAFAPENHQWLKAKENLKKGKRYNDNN